MPLTLYFGGTEVYDEVENRFYKVDSYPCRFEHSLYSISLWEAEYKKAFFYTNDKTPEELLAYIQMMALDEFDIGHLDETHIKKLNDYIEDHRTATTIKSSNSSSGKGTSLTTEVIYAQMAEAQIPFEAEHWHISRLMTLIGVIGARQRKQKPMSKEASMRAQHQQNMARRKARTKAH